MKVSWFVPMFLWMKLDLVFLKGYAMSSTVFFVVFVLSVTLGSFSSNGQFCVPTLLKRFGVSHLVLKLAGFMVGLVLSIEMDALERALTN